MARRRARSWSSSAARLDVGLEASPIGLCLHTAVGPSTTRGSPRRSRPARWRGLQRFACSERRADSPRGRSPHSARWSPHPGAAATQSPQQAAQDGAHRVRRVGQAHLTTHLSSPRPSKATNRAVARDEDAGSTTRTAIRVQVATSGPKPVSMGRRKAARSAMRSPRASGTAKKTASRAQVRAKARGWPVLLPTP